MRRLKRIKIFLAVSSILTLIFAIGFTCNRNLYTVIIHGNQTDAFMDYFNSVSHAIGRMPYDIKAIYPPLCYVFYWIMGILMGDTAMNILSEQAQVQLELKGLTLPMMIFGIYFLISFGSFLFLTYKMLRGKIHEKVWFLIIISLSVPFVFQFERANIIFVSLLGSLAFFLLKDSKYKYLRELALLCLALSAALKIYPAIFGLVLVKEKRYRETVRLVVYGIICFFIPFLFIRGGFSNIPIFIKNLIYTSTIDQANRDGYKLSYSALSSFLIEKLTNNSLLAEQVGVNISVMLAFFGLCAFPWIRKSWKSILLLACLLVGVPNMSYVYASIFLVIPLICFLNSEEKGKENWLYVVLFLMVFFPLPFGWNNNANVENYYIYNRSFNSLQISSAIFLMTMLLIGEGLISFCRQSGKKILVRSGIVCVCIFAVLFVTCIASYNSYNKKIIEQNNEVKQKNIGKQKTIEKCEIIFNGKRYSGMYKGETTDLLPKGMGIFIFEGKSGIARIEGEFNNNSVSGSTKIVYSDGQYEVVKCQNGYPYGRLVRFDAEGNQLSTDWYYESEHLSDIKKSAVEAKYNEINIIEMMTPGKVFKYKGKVEEVHQFNLWVEVEVEDSAGNKYLSVYENGIIGSGSHAIVPNLKVGDIVECYGTVNQISKNLIPKVDIITIDLADSQEVLNADLSGVYEDIVRYPYLYVEEKCKLLGNVKRIEYDYEKNMILCSVNKAERGGEYIVGIELGGIFAKGYILPLDEKKDIMKKVKENLPDVGDEIQIQGDYAGNYILENTEKGNYVLIPFVRLILNDVETMSFVKGYIK